LTTNGDETHRGRAAIGRPCYTFGDTAQEATALTEIGIRPLEPLDRRLTTMLAAHGLTVLRIALGIVFLWFGALKLFPGASPAEQLAGRTIETLTGGFVPASVALPVLAIWEVVIGVGLLVGRWMRLTLLLLVVQMAGTVTPLFLFPAETWVQAPLMPTLEGQYIIKNIVLVAAALVLGATVRGGELTPERVDRPDDASIE
jgi:uncharacterized membrane protein YphA (DoxX/SURF4 family)